MCGIYGMVATDGAPLAVAEAADRMAAALRHRGPDGHGRRAFHDSTLGVSRLRVIDLDPRADQPFADPRDAVVLACNGEIYNAPELRRRYAGYPYRSASDVEVILPLYLDRGVAGLRDLDGMFAIAILDRGARRLVLARDRAGEKPLFVTRVGREIWFASEVAALLRTERVATALDPAALRWFLRHGYTPGTQTALAAVRKVPAGAVLAFERGHESRWDYWRPDRGGPAATTAELSLLVREAVVRQTRADVPVGVFTSGGLDSSLLAALAVETLGAGRVRTFAVGFGDRAFDERAHAARLSRALGTQHREVAVDDDEVPAALDAMAACGEPVGDPAAVPTWCLARTARRDVTVVLSGEGADELFGGYPTYIGHRAAPVWSALPAPVRTMLAAAVARLPEAAGGVSLAYLLRRFAAQAAAPWPSRHLAWFANGLPDSALPGAAWSPAPPVPAPPDVVAAVMGMDYTGPLRERLLVKVDRATMAVSLEARAPYLDAAVTRAAVTLGGAHVRGFRTKRILREVARPLVPRFILRRRKRGLSVPIRRWLDGPLAAQADRLTAAGRLVADGIVAPGSVARLIVEHRAGRADHGRALWTLLVLQHWLGYWNLETGR